MPRPSRRSVLGLLGAVPIVAGGVQAGAGTARAGTRTAPDRGVSMAAERLRAVL